MSGHCKQRPWSVCDGLIITVYIGGCEWLFIAPHWIRQKLSAWQFLITPVTIKKCECSQRMGTSQYARDAIITSSLHQNNVAIFWRYNDVNIALCVRWDLFSGRKSDQLRCSEHTDQAAISLIFQDSCGGLEVRLWEEKSHYFGSLFHTLLQSVL